MLPEIGTVVRSLAGRDCECFLVVIGVENGMLLVADGKERPLERPKHKNVKHLAITKAVLNQEQLLTNRSIRHALSDFKAHTCQGEI